MKPELNYYLSLSMTLGEYAENDKENSESLYERSIATIKEAEKIYGVTSDTQLRLGNKYMMLALKTDNLELLNTARLTYQKAIELDENNVNALNNLGHNLINLGLMAETERAIAFFKEAIIKCSDAISKDPNSENPYYNLGISYTELWKRNNSQEKEMLLNLALKNLIHGESLKEGHCAFYLAKIYALNKNVEKSIVWLTKFLDYNRVDKDYITSDKDFNLIINNEEVKILLSKHFS